MGKLKNTGTSKEVRLEESERNFIDSCFSSILGIPSIQMMLRELCYLDSFKLDLEEWRGSYDLTCYFLVYVKVIEGIDSAARTPCLLVEDFFHNKFLISWDFDTYTHFKGDIRSIQAGGYISILLENKLSNIENAADKIDFETVYGLSYRFAKKEDFITESTLAIIKYFGSIELVELENLCTTLYKSLRWSRMGILL